MAGLATSANAPAGKRSAVSVVSGRSRGPVDFHLAEDRVAAALDFTAKLGVIQASSLSASSARRRTRG